MRQLETLKPLGMAACVAIALSAGPVAMSAQLSSRGSNERVLVMVPVPGAGVDSVSAVRFAADLRDRMEAKYRLKLRVIPTETICEALEASGFSCDNVLPPENAAALARFLQASGYVVGWLRRDDSLRVVLRLVDNNGSGLSGWVRLAAAGDRPLNNFARDVSDALEDHVRAAEQARECAERRGRSDFRGARDRVDRAFDLDPRHPSAAMCLALLFEVQGQPADSLIYAYRTAVGGDSLNAQAWERLGRLYLNAGDTTQSMGAFLHQLQADPNNIRLRHGIAGALIQQGRNEEAAELLDYALERNPLDLPTLQLKARACIEGALWTCALAALAAQWDLDTALAQDSLYLQRLFGAAQSLGDTAAMLRWSQEAVRGFPNSVRMWIARAAALKVANDRDGALAAYDRILELDSNRVGSALAAVQLLLDSTLVIDTVAPVDTVRLLKADVLLQLVSSRTDDTATSMNVAALYFNPGSQIARLQIRPHLLLAARFLEQTLAHDLRGSYQLPANFFLGLAYFAFVTAFDTQVREAESCEMVDEEVEYLRRARAALEIGRAMSQQTERVASQFLGYVTQIEQAVETYKPAFKCGT